MIPIQIFDQTKMFGLLFKIIFKQAEFKALQDEIKMYS